MGIADSVIAIALDLGMAVSRDASDRIIRKEAPLANPFVLGSATCDPNNSRNVLDR